MSVQDQLTIVPSLERVHIIVNGKAVADSLCAMLLLEPGSSPSVD